MSKYDMTIQGYESGLTAHTLEQLIAEQFPDADSVVVDEVNDE